MRGTNRVDAHFLQNAHLTLNRRASGNGAECPLIVVHRYALELDLLTISEEALVGIKAEVAEAKVSVERVYRLAVYLHFGANRVQRRAFWRPQRRV